MYIFIDEAGTFQIPSRPNLVSGVAALVVPEAFAGTLFRKFRKLKRLWRAGKKEIKGSELNEDQVTAVLSLVRRFDVLLFAVCLDLGLHTEAGILAH